MKIRVSILIFLFLLAGALAPAAAQSASVKIFGFDASDLERVRAFVSVTDSAGHAIQTLKKDAFKISENGTAAQILSINTSEEAIHVGLVIDRSGSMDEQNKLGKAIAAANAFVDEMRAQDEAFVASFDDRTTFLQDFTSEHNLLKTATAQLVSGDGTAFYDAVYASAEKFAERKEQRKNALILLTDGLDNRSRNSLDHASARAKELGVTVYTVGLGSDADQARLRRLADESGGRFFYAPSGDDLKQLYLLIAEQLQKEYALDFKSPRPFADGTQRRVLVTVTLPNGDTPTGEGVYVAGYLFNRVRANWIVGALLGLLLLTLAVAPTLARLAWRQLAPPAQPDETRMPAPTAPPTLAPSVTCPRCGNVVRVGARFCARCGLTLIASPAPQARVCPHCGQPVRASAKFCGTCRHKLS